MDTPSGGRGSFEGTPFGCSEVGLRRAKSSKAHGGPEAGVALLLELSKEELLFQAQRSPRLCGLRLSRKNTES